MRHKIWRTLLVQGAPARGLGRSFALCVGLPPFLAENRLEMGYRLGMPELPPLFADLQKKLSDVMASGPAAQVQAQFRQTLDATLQKMDLVTREEFDQQSLLLEQALMKLAELEARVKSLGSQPGQAGQVPSSSHSDSPTND